MPPRTRSTTTTAPAGRRPKVAGLRAPGRRGVTGGSAPTADPAADVESVVPIESPGSSGPTGRPAGDREAVTADPTDPTDPTDAEGTTATTDPTSDEAAPAAPAVGTPSGDDPADAAEPADPRPDGGSARPTPKARRTGRTMSPSPTAETTRRGGGTALLERPAAPRTATPAPASDGGSRLGRIAATVTRPVAALRGNPRRLITVLAVVLVLSLGLGTCAFLAARADRAEGTPYANAAVVDVAGTAEVVGQTRQSIEQVLSYDFTKLDDSVNAAKAQTTGTFSSEYLSVFEQTIRKPATDQRLRQTATVLNIGVQQLSADRATVMALVQFTAERTTNGQTTNAPGLLTVQVVKEDGRWKISELQPV